ncbi:DUF551 domain-containing protein [Enterobacter hormaechei]|uniref:DUF551 domain-containing protein n=1 Tax=Enterobacter hormaechei TaxID=158836 RepID=UPI0030760E0F
MSTITKERLTELSRRENVGAILGEEIAELARIALASLEAEPVGEVSEQRDGLVMDGTVDLGGASTHRIIKGASKMKRLPLGTKFYTATPAPVSVPDAIHSQGEKSASDDYYALGWNACRAAMLKHSEPFIVTSDHRMMEMPQVEAINAVTAMLQGADDNSPVVPDGWVACSERMPEDEEDVLCFGKYGDNDIDEERYQFMVWLSSKGIKKVWRVSDGDSQNRRARVTHWMPLPAAPQQEADNG